MNKVEKIKVEIERLKNELIQEAEKGYKSEFDEGRISAFEDLIIYIDSLSDTEKDFGIKSNDLEEAAHSYVDTTIEWFDSEGNPCCYLAFKAGANWKNEQMMKDAKPADINYWNQRGLSIHFDESLERLGFKEDDKVKVIIIKEAEK